MSYQRLKDPSKNFTGPVRPLNMPQRPGLKRQEFTKVPKNLSVTFNTEQAPSSSVLQAPTPSGLELVASSSAPPLLQSQSSNTSYDVIPETPDSTFLQRRKEIRSPLVNSRINEKPSHTYNRAELRINTLVSMLSVVIGSAALVASVSKNRTTNIITFILTIIIVTVISLLLIKQLYQEDREENEDKGENIWRWHGYFGVVTYIFIILILSTYFIDSALA